MSRDKKIIDVKQEPNREKLNFMSTGSLGGMCIGSTVLHFFPSDGVWYVFIALGLLSIFNMTKLNIYS